MCSFGTGFAAIARDAAATCGTARWHCQDETSSCAAKLHLLLLLKQGAAFGFIASFGIFILRQS